MQCDEYAGLDNGLVMALHELSDRGAGDLTDAELDEGARARDSNAIREITRRYNQRLFRVAWSILKDRSDAEEAVQDAYMRAFTGASGFNAQSSYATWITRIAINQALERRRAAARRARLLSSQEISEMADYRARRADAPISLNDPEQAVARAQFARRIESAVAQLPEKFRSVFILRDMEHMSVEETADALAIPRSTVKTRLLRAHRRLKEILAPELRGALDEAFPFRGRDCIGLTNGVLARLGEL